MGLLSLCELKSPNQFELLIVQKKKKKHASKFNHYRPHKELVFYLD